MRVAAKKKILGLILPELHFNMTLIVGVYLNPDCKIASKTFLDYSYISICDCCRPGTTS